MVKQRHFRLILIIVFAALGATFLSACGGSTSTNTTKPCNINSLPTHAATTSLADYSDTWQGQATYNNGQSFDMFLTIITDDGSTFSGTLGEDTYNSTVAISGNITNSSDTGSTIIFTDPSTISGGQIALNVTYTATVSNRQMNGFWYYPGDTSADGTISLSKTPVPDFSSSGISDQSAQLRDCLAPLKQWFNDDTINTLVNIVSQAEDALGCANNLKETSQRLVGAVSFLYLTEDTLTTCGKTALQRIVTVMENAGQPLKSDAPEVESFIEEVSGAFP